MTLPIFHAASDIVVVGTNPEMEDYDNQRGEIYGHAAFVVAEFADGRRIRLHVATAHWLEEVEPRAVALAAALNARAALGKLPVGFHHWAETYPAYGSAAFSNEEMVEWERNLEENQC
jgi:hypothetical protein